MKKISTRNYRKHYILHLLPTSSKNGEIPYVATSEEAAMWYSWLNLLIKSLVKEPIVAKNMLLRVDQLRKNGGVVASLQTIVLPLRKEDFNSPPPLVYLDLNYAVTKEVGFFIGTGDATQLVAKSDKLTGLLTRFLKELYTAHEEYVTNETPDQFIDELFFVDDIDMVLDENEGFKVLVDPALRDFILALKGRLRINA